VRHVITVNVLKHISVIRLKYCYSLRHFPKCALCLYTVVFPVLPEQYNQLLQFKV